MRLRLTSALLALALVPLGVALPTVSSPAATPHAVAPKISRLDLPLLPAGQRLAQARRAVALPGGGVPVVLTAPQRTKAFDVAGVTWKAGTAPAGMLVQVRAREKGTWTDWQTLLPLDGGPDPSSEEGRSARASGREGTEPFRTEAATGVQVRVLTPDGAAPQGLQTALVDGGRSSADSLAGQPFASAGAAVAAPTVITRAQWGCDEKLTHGTPEYNTEVKALVLHNTAGSNTYTMSSAFAQLRGDYAYHTVTLGWNDLGYNMVVDRFGRIYEGRRGSITRMVVGAHAGGFNYKTFGFSIMGNFQIARPPAEAIAGIKVAMAWKAQQFGINPFGTATLTSAGGGTSRYKAGTVVTKPTIMGHLDVGNTDCPGQYLYPYLPAIRAYIKAVAVSPLTGLNLTPRATDYAGAPIHLVAQLFVRHTWTMTVASYCGGVVRTLTGSGAAGAFVAAWDLKNDGGGFVPPGLYTVFASLRSDTGVTTAYRADVEVLTTESAPDPACSTARYSGHDAYTTSVIVGRSAWPSSTGAVLVNVSSAIDGIVAAPLAVAKHAPLLLTATNALPAVIAAELRARHTTKVWIVGGTAVVSAAVQSQLTGLGVRTIVRLEGGNRFGTAEKVAYEMGAPVHAAVVVSGMDANLIDAVSVAGVAGRLTRPILLVTPNAVPPETARAVATLHITMLSMIGSTHVVSDAVSNTLLGLGVTSRWRLGGSSAFDTAAVVASGFGRQTGTSRVSVVAGDYPTIIDGFLAGQLGRPTVLTSTKGIPTVTSAWLKAANPGGVALVGGPNIVSTTTMRALATAAAS